MRRWLILAILMVCARPAYGQITASTGNCYATATSCTLSATATGNVNIFFAFRSGSNTAPALPAGYTNIATPVAGTGGTTSASRIYCKVATSGADTGSGTSTNATAVAGVSYGGTQVSATAPCGVQALSIVTPDSAKTSTTATYLGITVENTNNWIIGFLGDSAGTTCTPSSLTAVGTPAGDVRISDSNGTVSSFSTATCTGLTSGTWISVTAQLQGPNPICSGTCPSLKRSWGNVGISSNQPDTADDYTPFLEATGLPRSTAVNDLLVVAVANPVANTPTVTDSASDTFTLAKSCSDASRLYSVYYAFTSANVTNIKVHFGSKIADVQIDYALFYNTATSTPVDGTPSCTTNTSATNNGGSNVQSGSTTTTGTNDLLYNVIFSSSAPLGIPHPITAMGFGSGFTGLFSEPVYGAAAQYEVVASASTVNAGMGIAQATDDPFTSISVAFKSGSGGAAPTAGKVSVIRSQKFFANNLPSSNQEVTFPTSGNLRVGVNEAGTNGTSFTGITWSDGASCTAIASVPAFFPQLYHCDNTGAAGNLTGTLNLGTGTGTNLMELYDIVGAATSPLDTGAAAANSSALTAAGSGATKNSGTQGSAGQTITDGPSIVPSQAGDLIIAAFNIGTGPPSGSTCCTYEFVPATWNTGGGDQNAFTNGDGEQIFNSSNTSTVNIGYTMVNASAASWQALAAAFKVAPATTQLVPQVFVIHP